MLKKAFEYKFVIKFVGSVTAGFFLILILLYLLSSPDGTPPFCNTISKILGTDDILIATFVLTGIIEILLITAVIVIISIFTSHKLAGPLFRLERVLEDFSKGDIKQKKIRFRKSDPFELIEATYNSAVEELTLKLKGVNNAYKNMNKAIEKLDGSAEAKKEFLEKVNLLDKEIRQFKI
jgi:methyl-accepting chemotaxis protein